MIHTYFETKRLIFRDWKPEDLPFFLEMNRDPRVMEFYPKPLNPEETKAFLTRIENELVEYGYGLYAVETKEKQQFIGYIGFHNALFPAPFTPCIEIGWRLHADMWGRGLATEGAKACLQFGQDELHLEKVYSFTSVLNRRSERVMQKAGLKKTGEFLHPFLPEAHPLCRHFLYQCNFKNHAKSF